MVKRDKLIKVRASEYDKAVSAAVADALYSKHIIQDASESDWIRYALFDLATKHLTDEQMLDLRVKYMHKNWP